MLVTAMIVFGSLVPALVSLVWALARTIGAWRGDRPTRVRAVVASGVALLVTFIPVPLGLLGTMVSLVLAFSAISQVDPSQKATILAGAISEAMNLTVFGLVATPLLAVPALILLGIAVFRLGRAPDGDTMGQMSLDGGGGRP